MGYRVPRARLSFARYASRAGESIDVEVVEVICSTAVAFLCATADSQTTFATIFGNVTDSSGAVVPGVIVKAINLETNVQTETKSNSAGVYTIPQLKEGKYKVLAQAAGFKAF